MTSSEGTRRRRRRILRWLGRGLAAAGAGMLAMMAFTFLWVADIQPRELRGGITEEAEERGRALLARYLALRSDARDGVLTLYQ